MPVSSGVELGLDFIITKVIFKVTVPLALSSLSSVLKLVIVGSGLFGKLS